MMKTIFNWDIMTSKVLGMGITSRCIVEAVLSMRRSYSHIIYGDVVAILSERRLNEDERYSSDNRHPKLQNYLEYNREMDVDNLRCAFELASENGIHVIPVDEIGAVYFRFTQRVLYATAEEVMVFIREKMRNIIGIMDFVFPVQNLDKTSSVGVYLLSKRNLVEACKDKCYPDNEWKPKAGEQVHITSFNHLVKKKVIHKAAIITNDY